MTAPEASALGSSMGASWSSILTGKSPSRNSKTPPAKAINGTIYVQIPKEVILDSSPLWKSYVVGHFIGDSAPHIGKVHATVNRLWTEPESKAKIDVNFINSKTVLFKIESETARSRVIRRQFWHISDIPMVVRAWSPSTADAEPDLTAIPLWVDLANVPDHLFSRRGLMFLGDSIGVAQRLHPNTEKCTRFDVARVLVEVDLTKELPEKNNLGSENKLVEITYPWLPPRCATCCKWGHKNDDCSRTNLEQITTERSPEISEPCSAIPTLIVGEEQRMNHESVAEVLGVQEPIVGQECEGHPGAELPKQMSSLVQLQEQNAEAESQIQVISNTPSPPLLTSGGNGKITEHHTISHPEKQSMETEEGEIRSQSVTPTKSDDEANPLQIEKVKEGGGYQLRNASREPNTTKKESKKANRKNSNIKSSSRKA